MRKIHRIAWLFHVEMSVRRAVQQALTPSKRKGWSVVEREQAFGELEAAKKFAENVRPLNL